MGPGIENGRFSNPVQAFAAVIPHQSALDRLRWIQSHRSSIFSDIRHNWTGWTFSLLFHVSIVAMATFLITETVRDIAPPVVIDVPTNTSDNIIMTTATLDDLFPNASRVNTDIEGPEESVWSDSKVGPNAPGAGEGDPGGYDIFTMGGGLAGIGFQGGIGDDHTSRKVSTSLQGIIDIFNAQGLDVVFVFDSTGSMGGILSETKTRIRQFMKLIHFLVPEARLALVTYRDLPAFDPEYEYTVKAVQFTKEVKPLEDFLRGIEAYAGGDQPEAIYQGLETAMNLHWGQGTKKVIILFGDAPPRPENGGLNKLNALCASWHKRTGGIISCIDTTGNLTAGYKLMSEFRDVANASGGEAMVLSNPRDLIRQLTVYIFGSKWKGDLDGICDRFLDQSQAPRVLVD